jgi:hypothetical protein
VCPASALAVQRFDVTDVVELGIAADTASEQ